MGKIDCFTLSGLECVFYSNDHLPHHFHVIKESKWEVRVMFMLTKETGYLKYEVVWKKDKRGPSSSELTLVCDMVLQHKQSLLKEWDQKVRGEGT